MHVHCLSQIYTFKVVQTVYWRQYTLQTKDSFTDICCGKFYWQISCCGIALWLEVSTLLWKRRHRFIHFLCWTCLLGIMRDSASENRTENGPVDLNLAQHLSLGERDCFLAAWMPWPVCRDLFRSVWIYGCYGSRSHFIHAKPSCTFFFSFFLPVKYWALSEHCRSCSDVYFKGGHSHCPGCY